MVNYLIVQEWNTIKGWTVAERILTPESFSYVTDFATAKIEFLRIATAFSMITDRQKNARMDTDGFTYAKMGRNGNLDEIVVKMFKIGD